MIRKSRIYLKYNRIKIPETGSYMYPSDGTDIKKLIAMADKAMYFVKENGGNSFHFNLDTKGV